jgi:predicted MFS family arabinose efflux permease
MQTAQPTIAAPSATYARYVLALFVLANGFNFLDRQILSILIDPIKAELGVSDTAMGFLTGPAFAFFYTFAGIPLARLADRGSRVALLTWGIALWSALTAASGLARSFAQLAAARFGVGIGEATITPCTHSMISDYFPLERRARALSLLSVGANAGIIAGMALGGFVAERYGWRAAFLWAGTPGIAIAALVRASVREPARGLSEGLPRSPDIAPGFSAALGFLWTRRSFRWTALGASLQALYGYAFLAWGPAFLGRVHALAPAEVGLAFGLVMGVGGGLGAFAGGALCDPLCARDRRWYGWLPALTSLAMCPFLLAFLHLPAVSILFYAPAVFLGNFYAPVSYAVAQGIAQVRMRGTAAALLLLIVNLIGLGLGPQVVGALNDALDARFGAEAIRWSLSAVGLVNVLACACFWLAARSVRADLGAAVTQARQVLADERPGSTRSLS